MEHEKRVDELVYCLDRLVERIEGEGSVPEINLNGDTSAMDAKLDDMR